MTMFTTVYAETDKCYHYKTGRDACEVYWWGGMVNSLTHVRDAVYSALTYLPTLHTSLLGSTQPSTLSRALVVVKGYTIVEVRDLSEISQEGLKLAAIEASLKWDLPLQSFIYGQEGEAFYGCG
jgi:hypothetical protein